MVPSDPRPIPIHISDVLRKIAAVFGVTFTLDKGQVWAEALADVAPEFLGPAVMRVIQTSARVPTIAAIREAAWEIRRSRPSVPEQTSTTTFRVVCGECAEAYTADAFGGHHHICDPTIVEYFRTGPEGRAARQAKGLAACTGRSQRVHGGAA